MTEKLTIVDYGLGNLHSIQKAIEYVGAKTVFDRDGTAIVDSEKVLLPGVGAFAEGMKRIKSRQQLKPIIKFAASGRPLLGICLGCQMLLSSSDEFDGADGLGLIPGKAIKISETKEPIPHVGWEALKLRPSLSCANIPFPSITEGMWTYFIHSYHAMPEEEEYICATCEYGESEVTAIISKKNIYGFQFHPEKSGEAGLEMIRDFIKL